MLGPKLQDLLVEAGLFDRAELQRRSRALGEGQRLADVLVAEGLVGEADLLRLVARASRTKFISSSRLAALRVGQDVLGVLPPKLALEHLALPIAWDAAQKSLTLVLADPKALTPLEDAPAVARARTVVALVALPGVIEAAVQRLYGLGPMAPAPVAQAASACPQCASPVEEDQLECGQCGLLLNPDAPDRSDGSIVRALLAEPSRVSRARSRDRAHDAPTRQGFPIAVTDESVPKICGSVDILRRLTDFEAYLLSQVDGALDVAGLSAASGLMGVEVRSMVASLAERGLVALGALSEQSASELVTAPEGMAAMAPPPIEPVQAPPLPMAPAAPAPTVPAPGPGAVAAAAPAPAKAAPRAPPAPAATQAPLAAAKAPAPPPRAPVERLESRVAQEARAARQRELLARLKPAQRPPQPEQPRPPASEAPPKPEPATAAPRPRADGETENAIQRALAHERRGDVNGAIKLLESAIASSPNPAPLFNRLAIVLLNRHKDARRAQALLHKAIELEPENPVYRQNLLKVLAHVSQ